MAPFTPSTCSGSSQPSPEAREQCSTTATARHALMRDAIPRSDPASIIAACAIGRDRAFRSVEELRSINVPALIVPGADARHPTRLGQEMARSLPHGQLAPVAIPESLRTAEDLSRAMAPVIEDLLDT